jgi:hypothetical protein
MRTSSQLDYMYRLMRRVLAEIGPRESGGEGERRLADLLVTEWQPICDRVSQEAFTCHPRAFLGSIRISVVCYSLAAAFCWWRLPWLGLPFALACPWPALLEVGASREFVDPLFRKRQASNVIATIAPRGELRQRLIVSAHMDSAYEYTLWRLLGNRAVWVMAATTIGTVLLPVATIVQLSLQLLHWRDGWLSSGVAHGPGAFAPFVLVFWFFHNGRAVPGAMDDLAGVSVLSAVAQALGADRTVGLPEHTEVVLLATACEEAGLRGARRFVERHATELRRIPTFGLFLDGICDERHMAAVRREYFTGARHDDRLVGLACEVGALRGWEVKPADILVGGTDAAAFSRIGVPAFTLVAMDCRSLVDNYHTRLDTLDRVRPEALSRALQIVLDVLESLDRSSQRASADPASGSLMPVLSKRGNAAA